MADPRNRVWHSTAWRKLRKRIIDRDGYRCRRCGKPGAGKSGTLGLTVHHLRAVLDALDLVLDEDNLVTLCRCCHGRIDGRRPKTTRPRRRRRHSLVDAPIVMGGPSAGRVGRAAHAGATSREVAANGNRFLGTVA
jgi:5-methylcytosine-specific restriction enzyme A